MTDPAASAPYLFISYASAERERALAVADAIEGAGVAVWIDRESITGGSSWGAEIVRGIKRCAALAVLCSPASLRSSNVQRELNLAVEDDKPILPLILTPGDPPDEVRYAIAGRQWIELLDRPADAWLPGVLRAFSRLGIAPRPNLKEHAALPILGKLEIGAAREPPADASPPDAPTSPSQRSASPLSAINLPVAPTSFVGREQELAAVAGLLAGARLVTLTGPGGTGKTRLALAAAEQAQDAFPDGVVFVELGALTDAELVPGAVAQALGLGESSGQSPAEAVAAFLRRRALLLVLDNFEQVTDAAGFVRTLLAGSTALKLLLTSRTVLRLPGEREYPVPPLPLPPPGLRGDAAALARSPAVALFVQRAQDARPDFTLSEENAAAVSEICRRLDGLPLAIELAAARVRVLTPAAMLGRLDNSLKLLTGGSRALPERQQTLRGAIQWSYDLLDAGEQALFRRLSVFAGGCTLESAEAVAANNYSQLTTDYAFPDVLDGIESLVEKSLLRRGEESAAGETRFSMLGTIRAFGLEQLEAAGELDAARDAHAAYYLAQAEAAAPHLWTARRDQYLRWADIESDNLDASLRQLLDRGDAEAGARLVFALHMWLIRHIDVGLRWTEAVLERLPPLSEWDATEQNTALWRGRLLLTGSTCANFRGNSAHGRRWLEAALPLLQAAGAEPETARALILLGIAAQSRGRTREGVAMARRLGDPGLLAFTLNALGNSLNFTGDLERAAAAFQESIELLRPTGDPYMLAMPLGNLGAVAYQRGDFAAARAAVSELIVVMETHRDRRNLATGYGILGAISEESGELRLAASLYARGIELNLEAGSFLLLPHLLQDAGRFATARGRSEAAARLDGAAAALHERIGGPGLQPNRRRERLALVGVQWSRAALGDAAYDAAFAEGRALSQDEAVALAQTELAAFLAEIDGPLSPDNGGTNS
ncbi:MAG: TIR domain-containing protein [Dehalococcoidia bacterium]